MGGDPALPTTCSASGMHKGCTDQVKRCGWVGSPKTQQLGLDATGSLTTRAWSPPPSVAPRLRPPRPHVDSWPMVAN